MIERLSKDMLAALVGNNVLPLLPIPLKISFNLKKKVTCHCQAALILQTIKPF